MWAACNWLAPDPARTNCETRLSLGASRLRLIRQLLTESALLGLLAGVLALLFTWVLLKVAVTLAAEAFPAEYGTLIFDVTPDLEIFVYVFAISLVAGVLFGLAPAIESSRSALSSAARGSTSPVRSRRIQDFLVAAQVALSLVLMIAGSMFIRSSINSLKMETGYDSKHVVDLDLQFPGRTSKYTAARKLALVRRASNAPGCPAGSGCNHQRPAAGRLRLSNGRRSLMERNPGQWQPLLHLRSGKLFPDSRHSRVLGRGFQSQAGQPEHSVVLSESAAKQLWPGQNPIGRSLRLGATDERVHNPSELLPMAGLPSHRRRPRHAWCWLDGSDSRLVYLPLPEDRLQNHPILIRTRSDPAGHKSDRPDDLVHRSRFGGNLFHSRGNASPDAAVHRLQPRGRRCVYCWPARASARLDGHLRHGQLYRAPPHARSWHPHGRRRPKTRHSRTHPARKRAARDRRIACRNDSRSWSLLPAAGFALWTQHRRCHLLRRRLRSCSWPSHCLPPTRRPGEPCVSIPWWRSDTNEGWNDRKLILEWTVFDS